MEIYKINTGTIFLKEKLIDNANIPSDLREIFSNGYPVNSYLIKYDNRQIVIDAGFSPNSKYPLGRFLEKSVFNIEIKSNTLLDNIDNSNIFLSHLHSDHTGYLQSFSKYGSNKIISNKSEYNQAKKYFSFKNGYKKATLKKVKFNFIDINNQNTALYPFLYNDFYNDGTFIILSTPGHSKGHVSFLLQHNKYKLLFTGDLLRGFHEFKYPMKHFNYSNDILNESLSKLKEWTKSENDLILIFGHNHEQNKIIGNENLLDKLDKLVECQNLNKSKLLEI